jgi:hypothetical protein
MDTMKQAIRENRCGKVAVDEVWLTLEEAFPEIALLRSRMEISEESPHETKNARWFVGYAPEFEALELGQRPPEYEAIFSRLQNMGSMVGLTFRKRDEDLRMAEFKAAADEWLRRLITARLTRTWSSVWRESRPI